jgi:hypothetical protein
MQRSAKKTAYLFTRACAREELQRGPLYMDAT